MSARGAHGGRKTVCRQVIAETGYGTISTETRIGTIVLRIDYPDCQTTGSTYRHAPVAEALLFSAVNFSQPYVDAYPIVKSSIPMISSPAMKLPFPHFSVILSCLLSTPAATENWYHPLNSPESSTRACYADDYEDDDENEAYEEGYEDE